MSGLQDALPDLDPARLLGIVYKHRYLVGAFAAVVLVLTSVVTLALPKMYTATAVVQVMPQSGREVDVGQVVDLEQRGLYEQRIFQRTQIEILTSRRVLDEAAARYAAIDRPEGAQEPMSAGALKADLRVSPRPNSQLVEVSFTSRSTWSAVSVANLVAEVYREQNLVSRQEDAVGAKKWLEEKLDEASKRVEGAHVELTAYKADNDLVDAEEAVTALSSRLLELNEAFGKANSERVQLEGKVQLQTDLLAKGKLDELARVLEGTELSGLASGYESARAELDALKERYGELHPNYQRKAADVDAKRAALDRAVRTALGAKQVRLDLLRSEEASLEAAIKGAKSDLAGKQEVQLDYLLKKQSLERAIASVARLSQRNDEVELLAQTQLNNVRILDDALEPTRPSSPRILLNLAVAIVFGIAGGLGLAVLREYLDDSIRSPTELASRYGLTFLGGVPRLDRGRANELSTHEYPNSIAAEAMRSIRTMLEFAARGERRFLVASSMASEGKTSTVVRLGIAYAQFGKRVVLVDCDARKPRMHAVFGGSRTPGVAEMVTQGLSPEEVIVATPVPNLFYVAAGKPAGQPDELYAMPAFGAALDALEATCDVLIVDTPPVGGVADALLLARHGLQVVLLIQEGRVSDSLVKRSVEQLEQAGAQVAGVVFNQVVPHGSGSYYRYYHYYRYGGDEDQKDAVGQ